jgi:predicted transcriptional regulator of viral defense system
MSISYQCIMRPKDALYTDRKMNMPIADVQIGKIAQTLASTGLSAVSTYEIGKAVFLKNAVKLTPAAKKHFYGAVDQLLAVRLLEPLRLNAAGHAYLLFGQSNSTAQEIACSLDPFAYVSHLSAMEYHGLTDRFPKVVFMSTPPLSNWRQQAREKMHKDLGDQFADYITSGLPKLTKLNLTRIGQTNIQFNERSQLGAFRHVTNSPLRVATIGRVFLDMIREPHLCGGIQHVIDVFSREAKRHLRSIVDEVDRNGAAIDKVRTGYLLSEVCKLTEPRIDGWQRFAQRGGSRKLDPEGEYSAHYSKNWDLSINVPSLNIPNEEETNEA